MQSALAEIDRVMSSFMAAFANPGGAADQLDVLYDLFVPEAVITNASREPAVVTGVRDFIEPRRRTLSDGTLVRFSEWEVAHHTDVFGAIAVRRSVYEKEGILRGEAFRGRGAKVTQLLRTERGWRIVAFAWDDERPDGPLECWGDPAAFTE